MEYYITELIDKEVLQDIQDAFCRLTGTSAVITDNDGAAVTVGSNSTDFCYKVIRSSSIGVERCKECDRYGAETSLKKGAVSVYDCHAGLCDFSVPIMCKGEKIGGFVGGQILKKKLTREAAEAVASDLNLDADKLFEAASRLNVKSEQSIKEATEVLSKLADCLRHIAEGRYTMLEAQKELERAASMKSDFLANMSHEIRTPMNAVIGMAEMILREDISYGARDYASQIKSSGRALLTIINDILDYSKIESGKMDLVCMDYDLQSTVNDIVNILETRLGDKPVELILSTDPNIPGRMYGDPSRIRQIIINIANNAIKFTQRGKVEIRVEHEKIDEENVLLKFSVEDTGIGIKKEDMSKLYGSFQQLDSKRNRNVEGTGLGLAITKNLLTLMGGSIDVKSEYEKGSTFFFEIPQKVVDWTPSLKVRDKEEVAAIGVFRSRILARTFYRDLNALGIYNMAAVSTEHIEDALTVHAANIKGRKIYLFFEETTHDDRILDYLKLDKDITGVIFSNPAGKYTTDLPNLKIYKRPISTAGITMALNNEIYHVSSEDDQAMEMDFTAPAASVLIVDDNAVNLTVAEGLLEPLKMKVFSANSGGRALEMIRERKFDIIFMDHMMPEMDGVETTRIIRQQHPECDNVPIIALTANAVEGMKEMFLSEGMNDFVAKPIEVGTLISKVKQWLPPEKIVKNRTVVHNTDEIRESEETAAASASAGGLVIGDLDTAKAIKMLGSEKLFMTILKEYYRSIDEKYASIEKHYKDEDWKTYTIEVHALKSSSRQIGAEELADMAADMEKAGNALDTDSIRKCTEPMLGRFIGYKDILKPYCEEESKAEQKPPITMEALGDMLSRMDEAQDNLDMSAMEDIAEEMKGYTYPEEQKLLLDLLMTAVDDIDVDRCAEIINEWRTLI